MQLVLQKYFKCSSSGTTGPMKTSGSCRSTQNKTVKEPSFKMEAAVRMGNATLARNNSATNSNVESTTMTGATGSRQYWDGNGNDDIDSVNHHDHTEGEANDDNRKSSLQNKNEGHRHEIKLSKPEKTKKLSCAGPLVVPKAWCVLLWRVQTTAHHPPTHKGLLQAELTLLATPPQKSFCTDA